MGRILENDGNMILIAQAALLRHQILLFKLIMSYYEVSGIRQRF
jgi:hypothetical protein